MGGVYHGLEGGYAPHEPRQFECCHAMKFTHTCLACPYISVNTVVSGRVSYWPPRQPWQKLCSVSAFYIVSRNNFIIF